LDQSIWDGIQRLIDDYAEIGAEDDIVIAYTYDARAAAAWLSLALEYRGLAPQMIGMAPLKDPRFKARLHAAVPDRRGKDISRLIIFVFEQETMSHNEIIRARLQDYRYEQYLVVRCINSDANLFRIGLSVEPGELSALNSALLHSFQNAETLHIRTDNGTDL